MIDNLLFRLPTRRFSRREPMNPLGPSFQTERLILRFHRWRKTLPVFVPFMGTAWQTPKFIGGVQSPPVVWRTMRTIAGGWALDAFSLFQGWSKNKLVPGSGVSDRSIRIAKGSRPEVGWGLLPSLLGAGLREGSGNSDNGFRFCSPGLGSGSSPNPP